MVKKEFYSNTGSQFFIFSYLFKRLRWFKLSRQNKPSLKSVYNLLRVKPDISQLQRLESVKLQQLIHECPTEALEINHKNQSVSLDEQRCVLCPLCSLYIAQNLV
jgi:ferredoxin-like protein FixX